MIKNKLMFGGFKDKGLESAFFKNSAPLPLLVLNFVCLYFAFYNDQNRGLINIDYLFSIFLVGNKFLFI
jgi:hypothetical protein